MKKQDLINKVAETKGISKVAAKDMVDVVLDEMQKAIKEDGVLDIYGFVKMESILKEEHTGRNPHDGTTITIPAKHLPKAKFSSRFKAFLND